MLTRDDSLSEPTDHSSAEGNKKLIVVVEDNRDINELLSSILEESFRKTRTPRTSRSW